MVCPVVGNSGRCHQLANQLGAVNGFLGSGPISAKLERVGLIARGRLVKGEYLLPVGTNCLFPLILL